MTRLDAGPESAESPVDCDGPRALRFEARDVPLGGVRGMSVRRALPQRELPLVGAWCFLDRFGPQRTRMRVEPHPHIGLQTVTWPFVGAVHHRDSLGSDVLVRRGALNIMTSGAGIAHSEYSVGEEAVELDALQLWVALPESARHGAAAFERHENLPVVALETAEPGRPDRGSGGGSAVVVVGEFAGAVSPATMHTPIVGAELLLEPGARVQIPLRPDWEHALFGIDGIARVIGSDAGAPCAPDADGTGRNSDDAADGPAVGDTDLLYLGTGRETVGLESPGGATLFLLGGEPFDDDIVMWWNFVARGHDEIETARDEWEAHSPRFGEVSGHGDVRIPAPPLPKVRLTPRRRRL